MTREKSLGLIIRFFFLLPSVSLRSEESAFTEFGFTELGSKGVVSSTTRTESSAFFCPASPRIFEVLVQVIELSCAF